MPRWHRHSCLCHSPYPRNIPSEGEIGDTFELGRWQDHGLPSGNIMHGSIPSLDPAFETGIIDLRLFWY